MRKEPQYLGDAVYVQPWNEQGVGGMVLTTSHHDLTQADNIIYLEPEVVKALKVFLDA